MNDPRPTLAASFRRLHQGERPLVLANAWDPGSARLIESLGAEALATTSAGVAWAHGYPDGDALPVELLLATIAGIARVVRVPLSVDFEGGYSTDPALVGDLCARVIDAGAVGINLEDGTASPDLLCAKIEHVKRAASRLGVALFVNARTDVYLQGLVPPEARIEETIARAKRYLAVGADGIFVPGLLDSAGIGTVVSAVKAPVNLLAFPGLPSLAELTRLGVRRVSIGSALYQAAYTQTAALATAFLREGHLAPSASGAVSYGEINQLMISR